MMMKRFFTHFNGSRLTRLIGLVVFLTGLSACEPANKVRLDGATPVLAAGLATPSSTPAPTQVSSPAPELSPEPGPTLTATLTPGPTPDPIEVFQTCRQTIGRIELMSFYSDTISDTVRYRIYLPACYDALPDQRFPVLYLLHGQGFGDDQWERLGVVIYMDALLRDGLISPFLVVMPDDPSQKESYEDNFGDSFPQDVLPWIDSHYRTLDDRQHRAVGGLSRGSGWAVHFGLSDWEKFCAIGLHSIAIFWADVPYIKQWLNNIPADQMPAFYIDIGDREEPKMLESATWFENLLTDQGIAHEWHLYHGYHDENYWQAHLRNYLLWYAGQIAK